MGNELVTDSLSTGEGGDKPPQTMRYGKKFEELCGYYMSLGMSYDDYWDGDCVMARFTVTVINSGLSAEIMNCGFKVDISTTRS